MDLRKLKTLIDLVSDSNVSELEITEAEGKVRIVKGGGAVVQNYATPVGYAAPAVAPMCQPGTRSSHPWWERFTARRPRAQRRLWRWAIPSRRVKPFALLRR